MRPMAVGSVRNFTPSFRRRSNSAAMFSVVNAVAGIPASNSAFWYTGAGGNAIGSRTSSTPAARRQAKLQMLQQHVRMGKTDVSLAHPFFWAPFILVGAPAAGPGAR